MKRKWKVISAAAVASLAMAGVLVSGTAEAAAGENLVVSLRSTKCMNIKDWRAVEGAQLQTWTCSADQNNLWYHSGERFYTSLGGVMCPVPSGYGDGAPVVLTRICVGANAAWEQLPGLYTLSYIFRNRATGKCLNLKDGNTANGALLQQWSCDFTDANSTWYLT